MRSKDDSSPATSYSYSEARKGEQFANSIVAGSFQSVKRAASEICRMSQGVNGHKSRAIRDSARSGMEMVDNFVLDATARQRLLPLAHKPAGMLLVHEIYRSIQGESTFAGLPCVFVRAAVCDARCVWCDTPHAFNQGAVWRLDDIVAKVRVWQTPLVEITGGEPLIQPEVL